MHSFTGMKKLSLYFINPFLATHILTASRENKQEHCSKTLAKFIQNPPVGVVFAPLIEAYRLACTDFMVVKDQSQSGMPQASSQRLKSSRKSYVVLARYLSSKVKVDFESDPAMYTAFFSQGLYKATQAKRGDLPGMIETWRQLAINHQGVLGSALVTRITDLQASWAVAQDEQSGYQSKLKMASGSIGPAWEAVAWAAFDLARAIVDTNPKNTRLLDVYFDLRMFTRAQNKDKDGKADLRGTVVSAAGLPVARRCLR